MTAMILSNEVILKSITKVVNILQLYAQTIRNFLYVDVAGLVEELCGKI
jgi:hypothetical protein